MSTAQQDKTARTIWDTVVIEYDWKPDGFYGRYSQGKQICHSEPVAHEVKRHIEEEHPEWSELEILIRYAEIMRRAPTLLPFTIACAQWFTRIRKALIQESSYLYSEQKDSDIQTASTAMDHEASLCSNNFRDFEPVAAIFPKNLIFVCKYYEPAP